MISIIIPVYNAGQYLNSCVDSILRSTYQDFELLLINDGSTDASPQICADYAALDHRVKLINQENQGVSAARNRGLEACRGEWIVFVDADDTIAVDFLSLVAQEEQSPDLMLFDHTSREKSLDAAGPALERQYYQEADMPHLVRCILEPTQLRKNGNVNFCSLWAKAYKKSIIEQHCLRFSTNLFYGEDMLFNTNYELHMKSCVYIPYTAYFYRLRRDSASHRFDLRFSDNNETLLKELKHTLDTHGVFSSLVLEYSSFALNLLTFLLSRVTFNPSNSGTFQEKRRMCQHFLKDETFRSAMAYNFQCGVWQRRLFLLTFRLRAYRIIDAACRVLHIIWRQKGTV
ncbi:MAG: glycosyltransferase [Oscillibacter sp.]|nr:glycosyltransferase [Oscillibacter sp.]